MIKIIRTDGTTFSPELPHPPTLIQLKQWIRCDYIEIVQVFFEDRYEQLIVDENGRLEDKFYNKYATRVYLENVRIHSPEQYLRVILDPDANIVGHAVLLTGNHKLD